MGVVERHGYSASYVSKSRVEGSYNSESIFSLKESSALITPQQGVVYYFDDTKKRSVDQILTLYQTSRWRSVTRNSINFFYYDVPVWLSMTFDNLSDQDRDTILEIEWPFLDIVEVYLVDSNEKITKVGMEGDHAVNGEHGPSHRAYLFPIPLAGDQKTQLLVKVETSSLLLLPIKLWDQQAYWQNETKKQALLSLFFGFVVVMGIYNFGVWFYTRDVGYFYYSLFVVCVSLYELAVTGYGRHYIWKDSIWLNDHAFVLFAGLSYMSAALFVNEFLSLKKNNPVMYKVVWALFVLYGIFVTSGFFVGETFLVPFGQYIGLLLTLGTLGLAAYEWCKGNEAARYFTLAWCLLLIGTSIYTLMLAGHLPHNAFTESVQRVGISLEILLLSFALGQRYHKQVQAAKQATEMSLHLATELNQSHEEKIRIQARAQERLEEQVIQRTQQLEQAKQHLLILSETDQLTGLKNRRYFDDCYTSQYKQAFRSQVSISIQVIDIDNFKQVNDRYGHVAGDECLKQVAQVILHHSQRPGDVAFRYGGEEFVVLLPSTDINGAEQVGQSIRQAVEGTSVEFDGVLINLTVSIGVAEEVPDNDDGQRCLLQRADAALYVAKEKGRNRVELARL
ncbi:hypothetical protein A9Q99_03480 [Gammaproteobacteria bacterium 45_16_T64]|nr:hypothetical protein A9Q99_03480 [Gammaproteobacteria bacterium 45_16_T64]